MIKVREGLDLLRKQAQWVSGDSPGEGREVQNRRQSLSARILLEGGMPRKAQESYAEAVQMLLMKITLRISPGKITSID